MTRFLSTCCLLIGLNWLAAGSEILAYYEVKPTKNAPVLDGKLDDACWKKAATTSTYYKYLALTPIKGKLKTSFKMLYDEKGIYLGITNYEKDLAGIRANAISRDDSKLWYDDCAEIYFDPEGAGIGFVKFATNSLATLWDMKRYDAAIVLPNWSGNNWRAETSKTDDAWIIEAFFPWSDLGKKATEGDVWRFDHVRYAWPKGRFVGVTWSMGGSYTTPDKFGFLRFAGDKTVDCKKVVALLSESASPPWTLLLDGNIITYSENREVQVTSPQQFVKTKKELLDHKMAELNQLGVLKNPGTFIDRSKGPTKEQLDTFTAASKSLVISQDTPMAALETGTELQKLIQQCDSIYWAVKTRNLIADVLKKQK